MTDPHSFADLLRRTAERHEYDAKNIIDGQDGIGLRPGELATVKALRTDAALLRAAAKAVKKPTMAMVLAFMRASDHIHEDLGTSEFLRLSIAAALRAVVPS